MRKRSVLSWILGYYIIEIHQAFCEDFLNICLRYGFTYYDIKFDGENGTVLFSIPSRERKKLLSACRVWQIRVRIRERRGLAEKISAYKGRWGLAVGALLSVALFCLSQSVLWRIDIVGNERLSNDRIIESLAENGMKVGDLIYGIVTDSVEQRVMINDDEIAWISVNIIGTVANVEVREVIDTEIKGGETKPSNLISKYDAQIIALEIYTGFACVKEGDFIRAGELVVSGIYESEKAPLRYTRSNGRVLGRVNVAFEIEIPLVQAEKVFSGEEIERKTLNFFGKSIKLFTNYRNLPQTCDIMNYKYVLDPFSLGELPICLEVEVYRPYVYEQVEISEEEAIEQAYEALRLRIEQEMPDAQILKKTLQGEFRDGKYVLICHLTAICDITKQVEFEILER